MGYIEKENASGEIVDAIRHILKGEIYLSPAMSKRMLHRVIRGKDAISKSPTDPLSDREMETFALISCGKATAEIAKTMNLSPKTIETYRARIKDKLELEDTASLTREASQGFWKTVELSQFAYRAREGAQCILIFRVTKQSELNSVNLAVEFFLTYASVTS